MQDAIGRIYFIERNPAQSTTVTATCTGLADVVIPIGALASDVGGNLYSATGSGTIGIGGTVSVGFACLTTGPIACPANTLTSIYQAIPGWDQINNLSDGVIGNNVESRADFEYRREQTVAANSVGSLSSVQGSVLNVANVLDAYTTENDTGSPTTIKGVSVGANSIYVAATGGLDADVATAIWKKKMPGCAYTGNTTVTVYDTNSGYVTPPSYSVTFERPTALPFLFSVSIANSSLVPSNAATLVQNAIVAAFSGADGGQRVRIASTTYATRFIPPVAALGAWAQVVSLTMGTTATTAAVVTASISGVTMTVTATASGSLAIGQQLTGVNVRAGTVITGGSGSSWVVSPSQSASSATVNAYVVTANSESPNMDRAPTINAANINVFIV